MYFSCLKLLGDPQLAEDITQETYLTALQKLGTLAQPENFPAWVNRIGINLCKMHFRNNSAPDDNSEEIIEEIPDEGLIPEEYVSNDAKRKIIMDIIDTVLTEEQRRSVILYYFDMLTVPEIAEVMNCTTGTVTSRLSAARKKIKEAVLIYEENNNDRLHAVVPVFILSKLLNKEASNTVLPKLTVFTGSASAANAVPDSVTSTKTISGGKGMFSTVKAKVIAGVCAVAVVGGGITAAVVLSSNGSKDNDNDDGVVVVTESQKSSESSSAADNKADTAGDNSDKYWITGFKGSDPSDTLPQDIFGSKISVPVDLSAIDGGNAAMELYGDDIGKSGDIMSIDKMVGENTNVEITFVSSDESQTKYDLISGNPFDRDASVADILKENSWSVLFENGEVIKAKTVIYGAGAKHRPLGLPEEADYAGKGISYCAICDGAFYKGKTAVVVGGGNTALDDALYLSDICAQVYLVHRRDEFRGSARTLQKIREKENITVITNAVITAVSGEKKVEEVTLNNGTQLKTDAVFVAVGMIPHTEHLKNLLELDTQGYVVADETGKTSQEGFFVAGDVRTKHLRQVITAVADGANAAVSASDYIRQL